ncbi:MAG: hypothetical protein M3296_05955 [Actinomycetota bacterium]|nr:hypothetical protein [Actinomycetota bacterium]
MTEQRLKVESGPPAHVISESEIGAGRTPSDQEPAAAERAKEKAQEVAAPAKEKVQQAAAPAKEKAREVAGQARAQAQTAAVQAKDKATAQVDERSTQVGQQLGAQGQALEGVADELRRQGNEGPAKVAEQAAQRVKDAGSYLEHTDGESLVQAATDAAREHPAAAAAAGVAAGFVAGRVLKASGGEGPAEESPEEAEPAPAGDGGS